MNKTQWALTWICDIPQNPMCYKRGCQPMVLLGGGEVDST